MLWSGGQKERVTRSRNCELPGGRARVAKLGLFEVVYEIYNWKEQKEIIGEEVRRIWQKLK